MAEERVQRRLTAILAADVVGYSRLMSGDEAGTLATLKAHRKEFIAPETAKHGGRIVKLMGDGALVEFPSVLDAVECAVAIQQGMAVRNTGGPKDRSIVFRIGINLGDVIIEGDDIYGDGVNVAARLETLAKPGEICISGTVFDQVKGKLDLVFDYLGPQQLKNIGEPVRVYRLRTGTVEAGVETQPDEASSLSERPSIAVLPFTRMSESREHEFLADGIVEDLTTHLARLPGFLVIARNSSFVYKDRSPDIRTVGRELGVRYVVEGSLRPMGEQLRLTVQLINAESGSHLWAEHYDRPIGSIFTVHDELVAGIVGCIEPALAHAEVETIERHRLCDLNAWHYYWKAISLWARRGWHGESFAETEKMLRQAIALDPEFALARARLALLLSLGHVAGIVADVDEVHVEAEHAIGLEPNRSEVLSFAGCALQDVGTTGRGLELLERAIELNPSNSQAWGSLGANHLMARRYEDAIEKLEYSIRISPRDPHRAFFGSLLAIALSRVGRIEEGINQARAACRYDSGLPNARVALAALLVQADRPEEASAAVKEALHSHPHLTHAEAGVMVGKRLGEALRSVWPAADGVT